MDKTARFQKYFVIVYLLIQKYGYICTLEVMSSLKKCLHLSFIYLFSNTAIWFPLKTEIIARLSSPEKGHR